VEIRDIIVNALNSAASIVVYVASAFVVAKALVAVARAFEASVEKPPLGVMLLAGEELRKALSKARGKKILPVPLEEW